VPKNNFVEIETLMYAQAILLLSISTTFTSIFCANILLTRNYKAKLQFEKSCKKQFLHKKASCKMLMKLTLKVNFINIL